MAIIATVTYQNAGNGPDNRQIVFIRAGGAGTLSARITPIGQPAQILGNIHESQIVVEMESTSSKVRRMIAQRSNQPFPAPQPNLFLSNLPNVAAQDGELNAINVNSQASGGRWIQVVSAPNPGGHGEIVTGLTITDPR